MGHETESETGVAEMARACSDCVVCTVACTAEPPFDLRHLDVLTSLMFIGNGL